MNGLRFLQKLVKIFWKYSRNTQTVTSTMFQLLGIPKYKVLELLVLGRRPVWQEVGTGVPLGGMLIVSLPPSGENCILG